MSGSTNRKIKDNNKQVKKQYQYDKAYFKHQNYENQRAYDSAVARTELRQANMDAAADYRDKIAEEQYDYQSDLQEFQFGEEKKAYTRSLEDYDSQVELNSMAGALAQEAEDRKLDEALLSRNFDLGDTDLALDRAKSDKQYGVQANNREVGFARKNLRQDKRDNVKERQFIRSIAKKELQKNTIKNKQLNNDIRLIKAKAGWDTEKTDNTYNKAQASNFYDRIELMVKKEKSVGKARAMGREGNSAQAEVDSALAEYGRAQTALVDSLVFAKDDKDLAKREIIGTRDSQVKGKRLDQKSNRIDRSIIRTTRDRNIQKTRYEDNKLDLAFDKLKDKAERDTAKLKKDFGFTKKEIRTNRAKIRTSFQSTKQQYKADTAKIKLDEFAANLAAQGRILAKPTAPPALPVPLATPRTNLPMPMEPIKPPKPIKGTLGKTSVWNDFGDGLNAALQVTSLATPFV